MSGVIEEKRRDALDYIALVKQKLKDKQNKYIEFLHILREYKDLRIDTNGVMVQVKKLFEGDGELLLGFNNFLPPGFEIALPPENGDDGRADGEAVEDQEVTLKTALSFVKKIKARFRGDENHTYRKFLDILSNYRNNIHTIADTYGEVFKLFMDHPDLLEEFTQFLPRSIQLNKQNENSASEQWVIVEKAECDDCDKGANGLLSIFFGKVKSAPDCGAFKKILDFFKAQDS